MPDQQPAQSRINSLKTGRMEDQVTCILEYFYEAFHVRGEVELDFTEPRAVTDSDMNSLLNIYLYPRNAEAEKSIGNYPGYLHLQLLADEIHPGILGYRYRAKIEPIDKHAAQIRVHLEKLAP